MMRKTAMAFILLLACTGLAGAKETVPTVTIDSGALAGVTVGDMAVFKGIPFAQPPVGPLRWRPPVPVTPWQGVRDASAFGPMCMQPAPDDGSPPSQPMSEDCLTLNIFAPAGAKGRGLPVMVWIFGGAFVRGSGSAPTFDGASFARDGVILVTLNHRVGRLGFFAHPALSKESADGLLGNYALMDLIAALQWVRRNIGAFGGDAGNVTLFGQSSGGALTNMLMTSPLSKGLFQKAISQSGLARSDLPYLDKASATLPSAESFGKAFAIQLGVPDDDVTALRAIPADKIVMPPDPRITEGTSAVIDGKVIVDQIDAVFARGDQMHIPYIAGSTSQEAPPFFKVSPKSAERPWWTAAQTAAIVRGYGSKAMRDAHIVGDVTFGEPAHFAVAAQAPFARTWFYRFSLMPTFVPPKTTGAPHGADVPYVFQTLSTSRWEVNRPIDIRVSALMHDYWIAFAKTGNPNGEGRPPWPHYERTADILLNFTDRGAVIQKTPDAAALDAIGKGYGHRSE